MLQCCCCTSLALLALLCLSGSKWADAALQSPTPTAEGAEHEAALVHLQRLLSLVKTERDFSTILLHNSRQDAAAASAAFCLFEACHYLASVPLISLNAPFDYNTKPSSEAIVLVCTPDAQQHGNWSHFYRITGMEHARHLVYLSHETTDANVELRIAELCQQLFLSDIYNVLLLLPEFGSSHIFYSCRTSAEGKALAHATQLHDADTVYADQLRDMHGQAIRTLPDQLMPRTILFHDEQGRLQLGGYVGKLLTTFAEKFNARLEYTSEIQLRHVTFYEELANDTVTGALDVAAVLLVARGSTPYELTYPYQVVKYGFMIPLPQEMNTNEIFTRIIGAHILLAILSLMPIYAVLLSYSLRRFGTQLSWTNILFNDKVIRGLLGQSFPLVSSCGSSTKLVCVLLCYSSLVINTTYQAYLQSFLTSHPLDQRMRSFEDMQASGLKVLLPGPELDLINQLIPEPLAAHKDLFVVVEDYQLYQMQRASFDTDFIYPVSETTWLLYEERQKTFENKMFYFSQDICLTNLMQLSLPIRRGLPYRAQLEDHILRIHESGLYGFWLSMNFYDMVRLRIMSLEDTSAQKEQGRPLTLDDFYWIWLLYALCMSFCLLVFVAEQVRYRFTLMCLK